MDKTFHSFSTGRNDRSSRTSTRGRETSAWTGRRDDKRSPRCGKAGGFVLKADVSPPDSWNPTQNRCFDERHGACVCVCVDAPAPPRLMTHSRTRCFFSVCVEEEQFASLMELLGLEKQTQPLKKPFKLNERISSSKPDHFLSCSSSHELAGWGCMAKEKKKGGPEFGTLSKEEDTLMGK